MFNYSIHKTVNANCILVPLPAVKSITVLALVNVGSRYEEPRLWGISHFLEHMVFKGTAKYPTAQALSLAIDAVGARFNAFTSKEYTGYYVKASSNHFGLALDVISDMLLTPQLRQEDIDREKGVIIEEINMYADMPDSHISGLFDQMMFDQASLGHEIIGTKDTVSKFVSADFSDHLEKWYGLNNVTLVLAGDPSLLNPEKVLPQVELAFQKAQRPLVKPLVLPTTSPITDKRIHIETKQTEQAHFVMGFPAFSRGDSRRHALSILAIVLGGGMSSRLFSEVREQRGLCYYIHADNDFYRDTGILGAAAGVDPKRVDEALDVTINEFLNIANGKKAITAAELQKAKDFITGKFVLDLEDSETVAQYFGMKQLLLGKIETPEELLAKYQAVTLDDVQKLATDLIKADQLRLALIGPFEDKEKFAKMITA